MIKAILIAVGLILVVGLGWKGYAQIQRARAAEIEVARIQEELDSAKAGIETMQEEADSLGAKADSLDDALQTETAAAAVRIQDLEADADSLAGLILSPSEPLPAPDTVRAVVARLVAIHESEVAEYVRLLILSDSTISVLRAQNERQKAVNAGLRQALSLTELQRDTWRDAANPGFLTRLKENAVLVGGSIGLGLLGGLTIG